MALSKIQEISSKRSQKEYKSKKKDGILWSTLLRHGKANELLNSQKLCLCIGPVRNRSVKVTSCRREGVQVLPFPEDFSAVIPLVERDS